MPANRFSNRKDRRKNGLKGTGANMPIIQYPKWGRTIMRKRKMKKVSEIYAN